MRVEIELLCEAIGEKLCQAVCQNMPDGAEAALLVESKAVNIIKKISKVLKTDSLSDFECIENIVGIFEDAGLSCGNRHPVDGRDIIW